MNIRSTSSVQGIVSLSDRVYIRNSKINVYYDDYSIYRSAFPIDNGQLIIEGCNIVVKSNSLATVIWYTISTSNSTGRLYMLNNAIFSDESLNLYIQTINGVAASIKMVNNSYLGNLASLIEYGVNVTNALSQGRFIDASVAAVTGNAQKLF